MVQRITINPDQLDSEETSILLSSEQAHYLTRVLRLKEGNRFIVQDGQGSQWLAEIAQQSNLTQSLEAKILETLPAVSPLSPSLRLIAAVPKGSGFDTVIRQATELGVTHIHPVTTARTLVKPGANKVARWRRIAAEASEQSERVTVPKISAPVPLQACLDALKQDRATDEDSLKFICAARMSNQAADDCRSRDNTPQENTSKNRNNNHLLARLLFQKQHFSSSEQLPNITIAIGPEGGWTTEEITVAISYDYEVVSLGPVILRAVTAPITALSLVTAARELLI
ncbi:MAG: 16S rRNA (uracil(1498)-N(3))-methyltransferase [Cyanobacteria bacterium P01_D01_bin.105]